VIVKENTATRLLMVYDESAFFNVTIDLEQPRMSVSDLPIKLAVLFLQSTLLWRCVLNCHCPLLICHWHKRIRMEFCHDVGLGISPHTIAGSESNTPIALHDPLTNEILPL